MPKKIIGCTEPSMFIDEVIEMVEKRLDGNPFKICANNEDNIISCVDMCDGVILSGGSDAHPTSYGFSVVNGFNLGKFDPARDRREFLIVQRCFEKNIPILGICRGHQILGIYHNLQLIFDLKGSYICHQPLANKISYFKGTPTHYLKLTELGMKFFPFGEARSREPLSTKKKGPFVWVNSFHHQGLKLEEEKERLPSDKKGKPNSGPKIITEDKVNVLGWAPHNSENSIVEIMSGIKQRWISCQFHPEFDWEENATSAHMVALFERLLNKQPLIDE